MLNMVIFERNRFVWAFFIFHLRVGTRLALRRLTPLLAAVFTVYYFFKPEFFHSVAAAFVYTGSLITGFFSAIISLSIARMAALRICLGLDGWIRHLPASSLMHRRLASVAIFVAQLPVLVVLALLAVFSSIKFGVSATAYFLGLPILGLASAQCVMPIKRKVIIRPLAAVACVFSASGHWVLFAGSIIMVIAADLLSGALCPTRRRLKFYYALKGSLLNASISWRALRARIFIPYLPSLTVLGATALFLFNNDPNPSLAVKVVCFGGALSIAFFYAVLANMLAARRPPWPWSRSLPWSAEERIIIDSFFLGLHFLPLLFLIALMKSEAVWPLAASLPLLTLVASHAMRRAPEYRTGASGKVLLTGMLAALSLSLLPLISIVFLALTPLALKYAVEAEKNQKVSRWLELHHLGAGDPLSWSQ